MCANNPTTCLKVLMFSMCAVTWRTHSLRLSRLVVAALDAAAELASSKNSFICKLH